MAKIGAELED